MTISPSLIGYCTNVHAGRDLVETRQQLECHAVEVKRQFSPTRPMGIGLWLSAAAASRLTDVSQLQEFAEWLDAEGLVPFTLNGFPYGDFHQPVVKHRVYEPTWFESARSDYTVQLIEILDRLLPSGAAGSISTLPIGWGTPRPDETQKRRAAQYLLEISVELERLEQQTGRFICLCLEPEPGCLLERSSDIVDFFETYLLPGSDEQRVRRYLQVCHDVCHAVVMFEEQDQVLSRFAAAGIGVGKVQISSAVVVRWDQLDPGQRQAARRQLAAFAEDRYLHQTMVRSPDGTLSFHEDLPPLVADQSAQPLEGEWRIHFHVPIYLERFGLLEGSRPAIEECLNCLDSSPEPPHYEAETYAWGVLPDDLRQPDLATGIARELSWLRAATGSGTHLD